MMSVGAFSDVATHLLRMIRVVTTAFFFFFYMCNDVISFIKMYLNLYHIFQ